LEAMNQSQIYRLSYYLLKNLDQNLEELYNYKLEEI